jgi:FeS assembly protein IscX
MIKYVIMSNQPFYWDSAYEIVLELMDLYPDADIEAVSLEELNRRIVDLPNFADDPVLVNDGILKDILREWYEETST